ncbi:tripartite tricarboxylate transporter substrate binding protein [Pigmentiphaga sp. H8]|uniref:Bug family tripartite tricarboxylate transporter substrate binding protein n=1 Tax=Pigmentiphaga sp. H8 TaxID=2488560 RepID=UPI001375680D|nr:tripartite tricarboxylate transporter substrate-binding protein [Pigmentiphaga sp. H8]
MWLKKQHDVVRRTFLRTLRHSACVALALASLAPLHAADFPTKPITLVVPFPAGGGPDQVARVIAEKLAPRLGRPVVVENRQGASGTMGAAHVFRAPADGHTLLLTPSTFSLAPLVLQKGVVPYDVRRDFVPVIQPTTSWLVLAAHPSTQVRSLAQLKQFATTHANTIYTGSGAGSTMHVAGEMLKHELKVDMTFVPHRGTAPALADTIGGHIQFIIAGYQDLAPHFKAGALLPVALLDDTPHPTDASVVPVARQGYPSYSVRSWTGIFAPSATAPDIVNRLNAEIDAVLHMPEVRGRLEDNGLQQVVGGKPGRLTATVEHDLKVFTPFVRGAGIVAN